MPAGSADERTKVVVAGATGYLGGHVVRALHAAGYAVRALARSEARLAPVHAACDEVFVGEATRAETLDGLMDGGVRVVFSSIGKHDFARRPTPREVDRDANMNLVRAAERAGVEHFVFVSVLHGERLRDEGLVIASAREAVVDALAGSKLAWTILRPSGFFNDMQDFFRMAQKGTGWLVGDGSFRMNPVHGADLAAEVVRCIGDRSARGKAFDVGGPDVLTYREILELAFAALGRAPRFRSLPAWTLSSLAAVVGIVNPTVADLMRSVRFLAELGGVAPPHGTHHLADFFRELAAAG
jgi:uncharacterized protein YbjT (DUF2867 family)